MSLVSWSLKRVGGDVEKSAMALALSGAAEGTVVASRRHGGTIRFSVVLRPPRDSPLELLRLIAAFCASEGIRKDTGIITWLRWPETVVVDDEVVARTRVVSSARGDGFVLITVTVNNGGVVGDGSTSLERVLGVEVEGGLLMTKILESLAWMYHGFRLEMRAHIMTRIRSMTSSIGKRVEIRRGRSTLVGTVKGIDSLGRLVVVPEGRKRTVRVGLGEEMTER